MYMQSMGTATMAVRVATVETATPKKANFFTDSTSTSVFDIFAIRFWLPCKRRTMR